MTNPEGVKYNAKADMFVFLRPDEENILVLHDWKKKTELLIADGKEFIGRV